MQLYVVFILVIEEIVVMVKSSLSVILLAMLSMGKVAFAGCEKTLMGVDCEAHNDGTSSHMRGNAVENAKAAKELKEAQLKAKKEAKALAEANKK
jgi:hypothetical protein